MSHIGPIDNFRPRAFCFGHDISSRFALRSTPWDGPSWAEFLSSLKDLYSLLLYTDLFLDLSFLTRVKGFDFIPIIRLQGVTTYHPLAVMGQFYQIPDFHSFPGATDYRFSFPSSIGSELMRLYDLWDHKEFASFRDGNSGQIPGYQHWWADEMIEVTKRSQMVVYQRMS